MAGFARPQPQAMRALTFANKEFALRGLAAAASLRRLPQKMYTIFRKRNMKHEKDGNTYENCGQVFEKVS